MAKTSKTREELLLELELLKKENVELKSGKGITDRNQLEENLSQKQYYLEKAQEIGKIGTWELDLLKNELIWTRQNYINFGVPIGTPLTYEIFLNCVYPDDRDYVNREWVAAIEGKPYDISHRLVVDGEIRWVREKAEIKYDNDGNAFKAIGFTQDITQQKKVQDELMESNHLLEAILNNTHMLVAYMDSQYNFIKVNKIYADADQKTPEFFPGKNHFELFPDAENERIFQKVVETGKPYFIFAKVFEYPQNPERGKTYWDWSLVPTKNSEGHVNGLVLTLVNVTERKLANETLLISERNLRDAQRIAKIGSWDMDMKSKQIVWSNQLYDLLEINHNETPSFDLYFSRVHPDDLAYVREIGENVLKHSTAVLAEYRMLLPSGTLKHVAVEGHQIKDEKNNIIKLTGIVHDISIHKKAENELSILNKTLEAAQDMAKVGYWSYDIETEIPTWSKQMFLIFGLDPEGGAPEYGDHRKIIHPDDWELFDNAVNDCINNGESYNIEIRLILSDGTTHHVNTQGIPRYTELGKINELYGTTQDISERKQKEIERIGMEEQLLQGQKMKSIATLAGGIAHKFNNALTNIIGNIELLEIDFPEDQIITGYAKKIMKSSIQMSKLTNQLLAYAKGGKYQEKIISGSKLIRDTLPLQKYEYNKDINIDTDIPSNLFSVKVDITQMKVVFTAIMENAFEAIQNKGCIKILCKNLFISEDNSINYLNLKSGSYINIKIQDNAGGMNQETKERIFEPFFTTKFPGRGLGLAAAYGIIDNHGGLITVDSGLGEGTTVSIYLPAVKVLNKAKIKQPAHIDSTEYTGTILIIDDEKMILDLITAQLNMQGYRILAAASGKEAIDIVETFEGEIDFAILDMILPDMRGLDVYNEIIKSRPDLKVIVCSGYSIEGPAKEVLNEGADYFIQKPFRISELSEILKRH